MILPVVLVTTAASMAAWSSRTLPIMGPPRIKEYAPMVGSAAATHSVMAVPTGTWSMMGAFTSPTTERNLSVTFLPCRASKILSRVPTLSTTHPTSSGRPRSGTERPVTCWTMVCSSPAG